jgi:hypothetical protein
LEKLYENKITIRKINNVILTVSFKKIKKANGG